MFIEGAGDMNIILFLIDFIIGMIFGFIAFGILYTSFILKHPNEFIDSFLDFIKNKNIKCKYTKTEDPPLKELDELNEELKNFLNNKKDENIYERYINARIKEENEKGENND